METLRRRLTRREVDLLLRRERGSKQALAERVGVKQQNISRWLHGTWNSRRIEEGAQKYALEIADRGGLCYEEVYVDPPSARAALAAMLQHSVEERKGEHEKTIDERS